MADEVGAIDLGNGPEGLDQGAGLYDIWRVKIKIRNKLYGGVPKSAQIIKRWHDERIKKAIKAGHEITPERAEAELAEIMRTVNVDEDAKWCGFKEIYLGDEVGPYLDGYNFKACFREGATQSGVTMMRWSNNRGFKQHYQHGVHIKAGDGKSDVIFVGTVEGQDEFVGHVKTPLGQKSVLSRHDYVASGTVLEFQIWSLATGILDNELVKNVLLASQEIGLGAARSREMSKFDLLELERINVGEIPHYNKVAAKKAAKNKK